MREKRKPSKQGVQISDTFDKDLDGAEDECEEDESDGFDYIEDRLLSSANPS